MGRALTAEQRQLVMDHLDFTQRAARNARGPLSHAEKLSGAYYAACLAARSWSGEGEFEKYVSKAINLVIWQDTQRQIYGRQWRLDSRMRWFQFDDDHPDSFAESESLRAIDSRDLAEHLAAQLSELEREVIVGLANGESVSQVSKRKHRRHDTIKRIRDDVREKLRLMDGGTTTQRPGSRLTAQAG